MTWTNAALKLWDAFIKGVVLLTVVGYMGYFIVQSVNAKAPVNMPDWIVSAVTIVVMYFFRRGMKDPDRENANGTS